MLSPSGIQISASPQNSAVRTVEIQGAPVLSGRIVDDDHEELARLETVEEYCRFARKLRGLYSITVREANRTTVITDHAGGYPVYFISDATGGFHVSSTISALRKFSSGRISLTAMYFYAAKKGVGDQPLYADVRTVPRGHVVRFSGGSFSETAWLDWESLLVEERPFSPRQARDRFIEIASEYLSPFVKSGEGIACLLSSGTDSAVCAYVLKGLFPGVECMTADYRLRRYSECAQAVVHAEKIGVRHRRVLVTLRDHRRALLAMNSRNANLPGKHAQLTSLRTLAERARDEGIRYVVGAEFAGGLFLDYGNYFDSWKTTEDYLRHVNQLSEQRKLETLVGGRTLDESGEELLNAMGCSPQECRLWMQRVLACDREGFRRFLPHHRFTLVHQLRSQVWEGVRFQNGWLPAQQNLGMQFIDPFIDIEMIRFAFSLPFRFKWDNGKMKALLRDVLEEGTGIRTPKIASPNPTRIWSLFSGVGDWTRVDSRLRNLQRKWTLSNLAHAGRYYSRLLDYSALGMWLRAHDLGAMEGGAANAAGAAN